VFLYVCEVCRKEKRNIRKTQGHTVESGNVEKYEGKATRVRGNGEERGHCGGERVESFTGDYYGWIAKRWHSNAVRGQPLNILYF